MEKLKVFRTAISPYQGDDFREREAVLLKTLDVEYLETPGDANVLITNTHTSLTDYDLSKVKLIIHPNSGYDNFSLADLSNTNAPIVIGHTVRANAVASYSLSALLGHYVQIPNQKKWSKKRTWVRKDLSKLKVQLIGVGHIGQQIQQSLGPIVKEVFSYDPYKNANTLKLSEADAVIFATGLNQTSHCFLDREKIGKLKKDVLIINGARGKLIDQSCLITFLKMNKESFAYLDVFEDEPVNFEQFQLNNLITTSHIAGVYSDLNNEILNFSYSVLKNFIEKSDSFHTLYKDEILQNKVVHGIII
ncbi:MAG: hypothetical protein KAG61_11180 [Bacteriovoracaceae bacterium]|nr:hypothetical protein [Bacteriovoracaceae bacterium]